MIEFRNECFTSNFDRGDGLALSSIRHVDCEFSNCAFSLTTAIDRRSTVTNAELIDCRANGCTIGPAIFRDVTIRGLQTNDLLIVWGALFHHVVLEGDIGKLKFNQAVDAIESSAAIQGPFDTFREQFYRDMDWALDISRARFKEFDFVGIPARLIRHDPTSQLIVTRARALESGWRDQLSPANQLWPFMIDMFLSEGEEDLVLVGPLGAPKSKRDRLLRQLEEIRQSGVAEPD